MMPCPVAGAPAERVAVIDGRSVTYGELHRLACAQEQALAAVGLLGRRLAVRARNSVELVALHVAAARTGTLLMPLNLRLTEQEQREQAARMHAHATIDASLPGPLEATIAESEQRARSPRPPPSTAAPALRLDAETVLLTSGTTGHAKGARLSLACFAASARACVPLLGASADDAWLLCLPLFHVGALAMMWRSLLLGSTLRLAEPGDVEGIARALVDGSVTQASFVPTTLASVLPLMARHGSPSLRAVLVGGGPVSEALLADARRQGVPALWTWGLTEATSQVATARIAEPPRARGRALPGNELRVVDVERRAVAPGTIGEIEVRGPTLFLGYLDDEDATAAALPGGRGSSARPGDGYLRTRDLGFIDDEGALAIVARRSDLIVSGGENVYPAMIERVLRACPAVADVAIISIADARWGQRPAAVIVLRPGCLMQDVIAFAARSLSSIARPDRFVVVAALPRNALDKVDAAALRALFSAQPAADDG